MNGLLRTLDSHTVRTARLVLITAVVGLACVSSVKAQVDPAGRINSPPPPTEDEFKRTINLPLNDALRSSNLDNRTRQIIERAMHYYIWLQVDPAQELNRNRNRRRLLDYFRSSSTSDAARQFCYEQIILRCRQAFNEPDAAPRIAVCHVLVEMNATTNPPVPFAPVAEPLLQVLSFPDDQFIQVKAVAVPGLGRILRDCPATMLPILKRLEISDKLAGEISRLRANRNPTARSNTVAHQWLMAQLVTALGYCDRVYNSSRQPIYADALFNVLRDPQEDWHSRARAAHALSRLPFEASANLTLFNYEVMRLLHDFSQQYNRALASGTTVPMARRIGLHIYFAYSAVTAAERSANLGLVSQVNRSGLSEHKASIDSARAAAMPIINHLNGNPAMPTPIPAAAITGLANWLTANAPTAPAKLVPESTITVSPPAPATTSAN